MWTCAGCGQAFRGSYLKFCSHCSGMWGMRFMIESRKDGEEVRKCFRDVAPRFRKETYCSTLVTTVCKR